MGPSPPGHIDSRSKETNIRWIRGCFCCPMPCRIWRRGGFLVPHSATARKTQLRSIPCSAVLGARENGVAGYRPNNMVSVLLGTLAVLAALSTPHPPAGGRPRVVSRYGACFLLATVFARSSISRHIYLFGKGFLEIGLVASLRIW